MKQFLLLIFSFVYFSVIAQQKQCSCLSDSIMTSNTTNCKPIVLKNGYKLYWQFNCDSIWLTLDKNNGVKVVIDNVPVALYSYTYRLGYQLAREYKRSLLFKSGCPANGPCNFILIDKTSGKKLKEFGELIYDHETKAFYDFIVYFSSKNSLELYYIDTNKRYNVYINPNDFNSIIPEYEFETILVKDNKLTLTYGQKKKIIVDLKNTPAISN